MVLFSKTTVFVRNQAEIIFEHPDARWEACFVLPTQEIIGQQAGGQKTPSDLRPRQPGFRKTAGFIKENQVAKIRVKGWEKKTSVSGFRHREREWSERQDSNLRRLGPKPSALARLSYAPTGAIIP